jgi:hypothetical protein
MPQLPDVPIAWPRGGGMVMRLPLKAGDEGMVKVMSRAMDETYESGGEQPAPSARMHNLSDSVFSPGLSQKAAPVGAYDPNAFELSSENGSFKFQMDKDGKFKMEGSKGCIIALMQELCQTLAGDTLVINYGSSAGSGHALEKAAKYAEIGAKIGAMKR